MLHGLNGEDGSLQGMLDMLHVPYASTSMLGSAVGMNKIIMKDIFKAHGLPITNHLVFNTSTVNIEQIEKKLNYPLFVKPSSLGSSIGISKVDNREELTNAIETAFYYDHDIIVEEGVPNLIELNCSVMEKNGEIITTLVEQPVSK
ncbi:MAG: ATP-grasp domain-containing protein [Candidatus Peribacteria bacterium]|nr:MAG: ATP-grasp domain-containing protein [Candidatus Peribacteria bacterium]